MASNAARTEEDILPHLLDGYRFSLCQDAASVARALDIRRRVYVDASGYSIPVPDEFDARSWFVLAEDVVTGRAVGSMRLTPRFAGPFEAEDYFTLPARFRTPRAVELNRFAILPEYRKGKTFIPVVSLGLFKVVCDFLRRIDAQWMVIASKPERVWTYEWLGFERTGRVAPYGKLDFSEHELLVHEFQRVRQVLAGHPFRAFLLDMTYPEVVLPARTPSLALAGDLLPSGLLLKRSA